MLVGVRENFIDGTSWMLVKGRSEMPELACVDGLSRPL
jgi:hypothetical protein